MGFCGPHKDQGGLVPPPTTLDRGDNPKDIHQSRLGHIPVPRHQETSAVGEVIITSKGTGGSWNLAWDYTSISGVQWDIPAFCLHSENMGLANKCPRLVISDVLTVKEDLQRREKVQLQLRPKSAQPDCSPRARSP